MDQGASVSVASPPRPGAGHRRAPGRRGHRLGLGVLLAGIAAATVAIPPLINPGRPVPASSGPAPAPSSPAAPTTVRATAVTKRAGPERCAPAARTGQVVEVTAEPSCVVYGTALGAGWTATGDGLKVVPGSLVPGTADTAMRVERSRPAIAATSLALTAGTPVGIAPGDRLTLRVFGGRQFGTVFRLAVAPAGTGTVTFTAPADRWTSYTVRLAELTRGPALARVDLLVVAGQVPNVNRFFLDDITIAG